MRILVTGVAGFIGSWVGQKLLNRGDQVIGLDNFDPFYNRTIKERNLKELNNPAFTFVKGDLLNSNLLNQILGNGIDRVVHLAALAGVRPSIEQAERYMRVNVEGTATLLESCLQNKIKHIIVASSSSVYGARSNTPFKEDDPCDHPASPYAASKKATELVCNTYHQLYGLGITCLRYFTVYGPRQRPEMAIHKFVRLCLEGKPIQMFGNGNSGRDYTFIDDIVDGTIAALDKQDGSFKIYNLGGANPIFLKDLISSIEKAIEKTAQVVPAPLQPGDVPITYADLTLAQKDLEYAPSVPLSEGLLRFVDWYKKSC